MILKKLPKRHGVTRELKGIIDKIETKRQEFESQS